MNKKRVIFYALLFTVVFAFVFSSVKLISYIKDYFNNQSDVSSNISETEQKNSSLDDVLFTEEELKNRYGSALILKGNCTVVSVFINDEQSFWDENEKQTVYSVLQAAESYIEEQSKNYGVALDIKSGQQYSIDYKYTGSVPTDLTDNAWVNMTSFMADYEGYCKEKNIENVVFMLFVNKDGRSYSLCADARTQYSFYYESSIIYIEDMQDKYSVCTVAHEMLHPFDADDLYFPYDTDIRRYVKAKEYFPNDIMITVVPDVYNLNVGEYTAYKLGWTDKLKPEYEIFLGAGDSSVLIR